MTKVTKNEEMTGLELSPRKASYLKFLLAKGDTVKTTEISEEFKVDPSTVTKLVAELADEGYIDHIPYRGVKLTELGKKYAAFCIRRHQILDLMFSHYGLTPKESCEEASRIETFVSRKAIDRMCASMGHPTITVCTKTNGTRQINHDTCFQEGRPIQIKNL